MKVALYLTLFFVCFDASITVAFGKKVLPPFLEDRGHRKMHSNSECLFGKQHKELGSSWFADLGPPFDVMYCIRCECLKVLREGKVYAHVKCRNLAKECQELTCEDQIQVAGRCCKVCRNETELTEVLQDVTSGPSEEEEKSHKYYAAVLTNSIYKLRKNANGAEIVNVSSSMNSVGQTATGRFTLHKHHLYYSFYTSSYPLPTRPKSVQFIDASGNIVEEQQIYSPPSMYQNLTGKICGVWKRVPGEYRNALKDENLSVILVWDEYDVRIRGSLMKYRPLTTEVFSSLMTATNDSLTDAAGSAIVSISTLAPSIHVMVVFTGILNVKRANDNAVVLRVFVEDRATAVFEETISLEKPSAELNVIEYSAAVSAGDLLALAQQRLSVSVVSARYPDSKIQGKIAPRVRCELHQAILSPHHVNPSTTAISTNNKYSQKSMKASGLAWMFIDRNSALRYFVTLDNVADATVELVSHRHQTLVHELSPWSDGTRTVTPRSVELLYDDELAVNVARANGNNPSLIRGRLVSRPVADGRDFAMPYLLKRSDTSIPVDMVGLIWVRIDGECNLHFDISIVSREVDDRQFELYVEDTPFLAPGAPFTRRLLEEFRGTSVEGIATGIPQYELARFLTNVVFLDIRDMKRGMSVLRTRWEKVTIPESCLPPSAYNATADNTISASSSRFLQEDSEQPQTTPKCYHSSQFYDHGTQWTSATNECQMCYCNQGSTKCDNIMCPELACAHKFKVAGSCCPSCTNVTALALNGSLNNCSLGGQSYPPGSAWYPYIPPNGFATCTVCQCDHVNLQVKCSRVDCPPLNCDEKTAYRPEKDSCCKVCPNRTVTSGLDMPVADQHNPVKYERDILAAGGCRYPYDGPYENGREWNPRLFAHGIERCVVCKCTDGKISCERKKCTKHSCDDQCCVKRAATGKCRPKLRGATSTEDLGRRDRSDHD